MTINCFPMTGTHLKKLLIVDVEPVLKKIKVLFEDYVIKVMTHFYFAGYFGYTNRLIRQVFQVKMESANGDKCESKIPRRHEEYQYLEIIEDIIEHGNKKSDRTGTGKNSLA